MFVPHDLARAALTIGAGATIVGSLCPWVASGTVDRSSYEVIDLIERLGFAESGLFGVVLRAWPLMPLLVVSGTVAMWWRRQVVGPALSLLGGLYALVVAITVRLAPSTGLLRIRFGPIVTTAGAFVLLAATILAVVLTARARVDQPAGLG